jgi:hypothetical protein
VHLDRTSPSLLFDVTPARKFFRFSRLRILRRRKQEQLHSFFRKADLPDLSGFVVIEFAHSNRALLGEFSRYIVMLELVFHEKQIGKCSSLCLHRLKIRRARRCRNVQQFFRSRGAGKSMHLLIELDPCNYRYHG